MDSRGECKQISVEAKLENLERVNEFVEYCLKDRDCSAKVKMQLELVVEEIFTNIANYAYGGNVGNVTIEGSLVDGTAKFKLKFMDRGGPYNPLERPDPDINAGIADRPVGGLGIYLVKKNVDDVTYQHKDGQNILTIEKII